ncbi:MAG TPA: ASKHA domain-containing protein [Atribacteraceae bacterium]|nr:ASKHA domain-containing protein [Atribacteraceae bacterium]
MPIVHEVSLDRIFEVKPGDNLWEALLREGLEIEAYCGGLGLCGKCVVKIIAGKVSEPNSQEGKHLGERIREGCRLACQVVVTGDLRIDVTPARSGKVTALTETMEAEIGELPLRRELVNLEKPPLYRLASLQDILGHHLCGQNAPRLWTVQSLQGISMIEDRASQTFEIVFDRNMVRWTGKSLQKDPFLGLAVDIGTTTVAVELVDLETGSTVFRAGTLNRQAGFGADVISRLRAIQEDHGALMVLREQVVRTINDLVQGASQQTGIDPGRIFAITVAGNTIMEHILLGVSPLSIGVAPYAPVFNHSMELRATDLDLITNPEAQVYLFPSVAGYVGGDIVAGAVAHGLLEEPECLLYVDIGTNGEIVLVEGGRILCCGTAAGPAFEGAQIKFGSRAALGAICGVESEGQTLKISTIGNAPPHGICGTGLIDALACLVREGLINSNGRLVGNGGSLEAYLGQQGTHKTFTLSRDPLIYISQEDISQLQLAKAAIDAGRKIMLKEAGKNEEAIVRVVLAGAFGTFINPASAVAVDLIPPGKVVTTVGNASLAGAKKALVSSEFRDQAERFAREARYIELSGRADFQDMFFESLIFSQARI